MEVRDGEERKRVKTTEAPLGKTDVSTEKLTNQIRLDVQEATVPDRNVSNRGVKAKSSNITNTTQARRHALRACLMLKMSRHYLDMEYYPRMHAAGARQRWADGPDDPTVTSPLPASQYVRGNRLVPVLAEIASQTTLHLPLWTACPAQTYNIQ